MLFGDKKDLDLFRDVESELIDKILGQEVYYYKIDVQSTNTNIYGESTDKHYSNEVKLNCIVDRSDREYSSLEGSGVVDVERNCKFNFMRDTFSKLNMNPEIGDLIEYHGDFYEVNKVVENQLFYGRDDNYNFEKEGELYGGSISVLLDTHIVRVDKTGLRSRNISIDGK